MLSPARTGRSRDGLDGGALRRTPPGLPQVVSTPRRQAAFLENPARPNAPSCLSFALWPLGEAGSARERGIWEPGPHNPHTPDATPRTQISWSWPVAAPRVRSRYGDTLHTCVPSARSSGLPPAWGLPALALRSSDPGLPLFAPFPFLCIPSHFEEADAYCSGPVGVPGFLALSPQSWQWPCHTGVIVHSLPIGKMGFEEKVLIIRGTLSIQDTLCSPAFGALSHVICLLTCEVVVVSILQMGKLRLRAFKVLAWGPSSPK